MTSRPRFPTLLQTFFTDRLLRQRRASPHTISAYRDTFRLLLRFASDQLRKPPTRLALEDLGPSLIGAFLDHLEIARGNSARTRNARLAAIHSFFRYVAFHEPARSGLCQRILAMPSKRAVRRVVEYLEPHEVEAILQAPDLGTWIGRRDRALILVAAQTGLRVSELTHVRRRDVVLDRGAHVRCRGKGRKERCTPLRPEARTVLRAWLRERGGAVDDPVFPSLRGGPLSRDAVGRLLAKHTTAATRRCPSLKRKRVTPHVLRHTAAMELLQHGVDRTVIALWLGHESPETTQMYLRADLKMKERALERVTPLGVKPGRYRPEDELLAFLEGL